jgi:hypothetical protein
MFQLQAAKPKLKVRTKKSKVSIKVKWDNISVPVKNQGSLSGSTVDRSVSALPRTATARCRSLLLTLNSFWASFLTNVHYSEQVVARLLVQGGLLYFNFRVVIFQVE